jgi:uncharacterized protein (TIRG00374 family)
LVTAVALAAAVVGLYVFLPAVAGLDETWRRLTRGDPWWLTAALAFEALSFTAYVVLLRQTFETPSVAFGWQLSYRITMAGVAATRMLATAGAGGIALTAWAARRAGLAAREVTARLATFLILLYAVFMAALVIGGLGLRSGVFAGPAPFGLTVVPAIFGATVIVTVLAVAYVSPGLDQVLSRVRVATTRRSRWARAIAAVPATISAGVAGALGLLRSRPAAGAAAVCWWAFDVAVLWACFQAFGEPPPLAVLVVAYFVGAIGNLLPVPGGIGAVDGGMIGALIGFGVGGGLAIVAVLSYRAFAFWLPTVPGAIAYAQLLRSNGRRGEPRAP